MAVDFDWNLGEKQAAGGLAAIFDQVYFASIEAHVHFFLDGRASLILIKERRQLVFCIFLPVFLEKSVVRSEMMS